MAFLQLKAVTVGQRLGPIDAQVDKGALVHLVGPNGAGKSTLLSCMAGLSLAGGSVLLNGSNIESLSSGMLSRHRGWLMQQQLAPFTLPVWHYLQLHQPLPGSESVMVALAEQLQLGDKLTRSVSALSGGEWQRVRLAALFLQLHPELNPLGQLLLLDEPMTSLDIAQQTRVDNVIHLFCEAGIAVVMSSHDLNHTLRHADSVWLMAKGTIQAQGSAAETLTPRRLTQTYGIDFRRVKIGEDHVLFSALNGNESAH